MRKRKQYSGFFGSMALLCQPGTYIKHKQVLAPGAAHHFLSFKRLPVSHVFQPLLLMLRPLVADALLSYSQGCDADQKRDGRFGGGGGSWGGCQAGGGGRRVSSKDLTAGTDSMALPTLPPAR